MISAGPTRALLLSGGERASRWRSARCRDVTHGATSFTGCRVLLSAGCSTRCRCRPARVRCRPSIGCGRWTAPRTCEPSRRRSPGWRSVMPCTSTGVSALAGGAVAELPPVVPAPAFDVPAGQQRARVIPAGGHLGGVCDALHFDRRVAVVGGAVAELPDVVFAPAFDVAARQQRARVTGAPASPGSRSVMPWTSTGVSLLLVVPSPSCPTPLSPQQSTWPLDSNAHECSWPAAHLGGVGDARHFDRGVCGVVAAVAELARRRCRPSTGCGRWTAARTCVPAGGHLGGGS